MLKVLLPLLVSFSVFAQDIAISDLAFLVQKSDKLNIVFSSDVDKGKIIDFPDSYDEKSYLPIFKTILKANSLQLMDDSGIFYVSKIQTSSTSSQSGINPLTPNSPSLLPPPPLVAPQSQNGSLLQNSPMIVPSHIVNRVDMNFDYIPYTLKFLQLDNVKPILEFSGLQYVFSPITKTIIFKKTKQNKKTLTKTLTQIEELDTQKDQVTIKITIFDVDQTKLKKTGINPNISFDFGLINSTGALLTRASIPAFKSSLAFLQSNGVSDVFQSTSYLIADGEKLDFKKVVSMPFLDENYAVTAVTGSVNQSKKYKYKDIGFKVSTTPMIVDDTVYLDFSLEVGNVVSSGDLPVTSSTNISNKFSLKKGDVILLAGIQKDTITKSKSGLPFWFFDFLSLSSDSVENATFNISIEIL